MTLEYTPDELVAILERTIQNQYKVKITDIKRTGDTITMIGEECTDVAKLNNGMESSVIAAVMPGFRTDKAERRSGPWRNKGMSAFIREQFSGGEKIHLDFLCELVNTNGFDIFKSNLKAIYLKGSQFKDTLTEVNPDVFQLTSVFNKKELVH